MNGEERARRAASPELPSRPMLAERARQPPSLAEDGRCRPRRPCARTPDGYVRARSCAASQLSAAQWQRWFVFARPAAAVVSERWAGPNVGPSVARIPRVFLSLSRSPLAHALFLCVSVSLSRSLARSYTTSPGVRSRRNQVPAAAFRKRKQRTDASRPRRRDAAADEK